MRKQIKYGGKKGGIRHRELIAELTGYFKKHGAVAMPEACIVNGHCADILVYEPKTDCTLIVEIEITGKNWMNNLNKDLMIKNCKHVIVIFENEKKKLTAEYRIKQQYTMGLSDKIRLYSVEQLFDKNLTIKKNMIESLFS